jgi:XTP/dITP diphosphohydrolase
VRGQVEAGSVTPRQFLLATRNRHKLGEIAALLSGLPIAVLSLADLEILDLPGEEDVEVFDTFEQNALAKARFYRHHSGMDVIADDSGLCVDALGGGPGVRSRRFASDHGMGRADQDAANNECLVRKLGDLGESERGAHYRCALACVGPDRSLVVSGRVDGLITHQERGSGGFGYDPLFLLPSYGRTFGELPPEVKASISHRAEAVRSFRRWLEPIATQEESR